jgi:hypothetical protein
MLRYLVLIVVFSCTSSDRAVSTLKAEGFTNVTLTGWSPTRCSGDDDTCTGFAAIGPTGNAVRGAVGCGYDFGGCGKGCTVRIEP